VADALPGLPGTMAATARATAGFERACVDIVEAALLGPRVGQQFTGVVVETDERKDGGPATRGQVVLRNPAVRARVDGAALPLGERVRVTLTEASVEQRRVRFTLASG
jgi:exoribonuclease R